MTQFHQAAQSSDRHLASPLAAWLMPYAVLVCGAAVVVLALKFAGPSAVAEPEIRVMPVAGVAAPEITRIEEPPSAALVHIDFSVVFPESDRSENASERPPHQRRVGDARASR